MRVLVLGDSDLLTEVLCVHLLKLGHDVSKATSVLKVFDELHKHKYEIDVLVGDFHDFPGDTLSLINSIKETCPGINVILMNEDITLNQSKDLENEVTAYLRKPVKFNELRLLLNLVEKNRSLATTLCE